MPTDKRGFIAVAGILGLTLVIAVGVWAAVGLGTERPLAPFAPPPREALLAAPPVQENGWLVIEHHASPDFGAPPTLEETWPSDDADVMAERLLAWTPPSDAATTVRRAFAMPQFAPDCPIDMQADCPALPILAAHRLAVALALRDVLADVRAPIELGHVLTLSRDAVARPRSLVTAMVAIISVSEVLQRVDDLLTLLEGGRAVLSPERLTDLAASLDALDPSEISIERGMLIEWIEIDDLVAARWPSTDGDVPWVRRALGEQYAALMARARDPSLPPLAPPEISRWQRFTDPGSVVLVETSPSVVEPQIDRVAERRAEIEAALPVFRARVQALLAPR